jgi:hypothetical protein
MLARTCGDTTRNSSDNSCPQGADRPVERTNPLVYNNDPAMSKQTEVPVVVRQITHPLNIEG